MTQIGLAGQPIAQNALFDLSALKGGQELSSPTPSFTAVAPAMMPLATQPVPRSAPVPEKIQNRPTKAFLAYDASSGQIAFKSPDTLTAENRLDWKRLSADVTRRNRKTGKHTVYNLTVEGLHTYIAGGYRVHNTSLFVPQSFAGTIGNALGGHLATLFGVDDFAKGLVLNAAGSALLSYFGDLASGEVSFTTGGNAALHLGMRFGFNLAGSVGGYFGSRLLGELADSLGLGRFGSAAFSAIGGYIGSTLATRAFAFAAGHALDAIGHAAATEVLDFASGVGLNSAGGLAVPWGAIGSFLGTQAAYAVLGDDFSPQGAQIGNAIGSLAGSLVASGLIAGAANAGGIFAGSALYSVGASLGAAAGPVGLIAAAVIVFVATVFGGLLGRKPKPWALTEIEFGRRETEEAFYVGGTASGDGGNTALSQNMAGSAVQALNQIVGAIGGTILATADGAFALGHRKSSNQVTANGATYYFNDPQAAVDFGVKGVLNLTDIEGGDIYQKRALAILTSENAPVDVATTEELRQALGAAATFGVREDNQVLTDAVFEQLGFAARARYEEALRQAEEIGVEGEFGSFASDTFRRDENDEGGYSRSVSRQTDGLRITYYHGGGEDQTTYPNGFATQTSNAAFEVLHRVENGLDILDVPESLTRGTIRVWRSGTSLVVESAGDTSSQVSNVAGGEIRLIIKNWSLEDNGTYWEQFDRIRFSDGTEFDMTALNGDSGWNGASTTLKALNADVTSAIKSSLGFSASSNALADMEMTARIERATDADGTFDANAFRNDGAADAWKLYDVEFDQIGTHASGAQTLTANADEDLLAGGFGSDTYLVGLNSGTDIIFDSGLGYGTETVSVSTDYQQGQTSTQTVTYGGGEDQYTTTVTNYSIVNGTTTGTGRQVVSVSEQDAGNNDTLKFTSGITADDLVFGMSGGDLVIGIRQADDPFGTLNTLENQVVIRDWRDEDNRIETIRFTDDSTVLTADDITERYARNVGAGALFVVDLLADGIVTSSMAQTNVLFDIDADGYLERTAWLSGGDGFLALDRNRDGVINDATELFSSWSGDFAQGLAPLSSLDTNNDGLINSSDSGFGDLRIWLDLDADGTTGLGELNQLHRFGVEEISLAGEVNFAATEEDAAITGIVLDDAMIVREAAIDQFGLVGNAEGAGYGVVFEHSDSGVSLGIDGLEFQAGSELINLTSDVAGQGVAETVTAEASYSATNEDDAITVSLGAGQSAIVSGFGGNDTLTGGNSDDLLIGGAGADKMYGGAGNDVVVADAEDNLSLLRGGSGTDLLIVERDEAVGTHTNTFNLSSLQFEKIIAGTGDDGIRGGTNGIAYDLSGGAGDDWLDGANAADSLSGDSGDDTLNGYAGADTILGGSGDDLLIDHSGGDSYDGGSGRDTLDYSQTGSAGVTVNLDTGLGSSSHAAGDTYRSIEHVIGTASVDTLIGSDANETFEGLAGGDSINGGGGIDTADYSQSPGAVSVFMERGTGTQYWNDASGDRLAGIENVIGSNAGDDLRGSAGSNRFEGGGGADSLHSYGGDDILIGGDGADRLYGGNDQDSLTGGTGSDLLFGGHGNDTYLFGFNDGTDTVNDSGGNTTLIFGDGIAAHSLYMTRSGNNLIIDVVGGSTKVTVVNYYVAPTNYEITMDDGSVVEASLGDTNRWRGNASANTRHFSLSSVTDDVLIGLGGNDNLRGAGGDDVYVYHRGDGNDTIYDFGSQTVTHGGGEDSYTTTTITSGYDSIFLGHDIDPEDVRLQKSGNNLVVLIMPKGHEGADPADAEGKITIQSHFAGENYRIEQIEFATGETWYWARSSDDGQVINEIMAHLGTDLDETFAQPTTAVTNYYYGGGEDQTQTTYTTYVPSEQPVYRNGRGGNDTITGANGNDNLIGGQGIDRIYGGDGDDLLSGGPQHDYLYGGKGGDTYAVAKGDGYTYIHDTGDTNGYDRILFGEGIAPEQIGVIRNNRHLRIYVDPDGDVNYNLQNEYIDLINVFDANGKFERTVVEEFVFASGVVLTLDQLMSSFGDDRSTVPDDIVWNLGPLTGVDLKAGDDIANLSDQDDVVNGGDGKDTLYGNEGFDDLRGDAGNDKLYGGIDRDRLVGGANNDVLEGGAGSDLYYFEAGFGKDTIRDRASTVETVREAQVVTHYYGGGEGDGYTTSQTYFVDSEVDVAINAGSNDVIEFGDDIRLEDLAFEYIDTEDTMYIGVRTGQALGTTVKNFTNRIAIKDWTDQVDGEYSNRIESIRFADGLEISIADFNIATRYDTVETSGLINYGSTDTIFRQTSAAEIASVIDGDGYIHPSGNSQRRLDGRGGDDLMIGGDGSDFFYGGGGKDTLVGGGDRDYLHGSSGDDLLIGSEHSGAPDVMVGSTGNDTYRLYEGQSAYIYETSSNNHTTPYTDRIVLADVERWDQLSFTANASHLYIDAENADGSGHADINVYYHITGLHTNNYWYTIEELEIGDGSAMSIAEVVQLTGEVTASEASSAPHRSTTVDRLFIADNANQRIYGTNAADLMFGAGGNDYLWGMGGDDVLLGGDGNDVLRPHSGRDTLYGGAGTADVAEYYYNNGVGVTVNLISGTGSGGIADGDVLDGIERVYSTQANDRLIGDDVNNYFIGRRGEDVLIGNGGNDILRGDSSATDTGYSDTLIGGTGNDNLQGNRGADRYEFALGDGQDSITDNGDSGTSVTDTVAFTNLRDLSALSFEDSGSDNLRIRYSDSDYVTVTDGQLSNSTTRVEAIEMSDGRRFTFDAVQLFGALAGWQGSATSSDLIAGGSGSNSLRGGDGDDAIFGGADDDRLYGDTGNDILVGGTGNDTMNAAGGTDLMIGGLGSDIYEVNGSGRGLIEDNGQVAFGETDLLYIGAGGATLDNVMLELSGGGRDLTVTKGSMTIAEIRDHFSEAGHIESVQVGSAAAADLSRASAALASYMAQFDVEKAAISDLLTHADSEGIEAPYLTAST